MPMPQNSISSVCQYKQRRPSVSTACSVDASNLTTCVTCGDIVTAVTRGVDCAFREQRSRRGGYVALAIALDQEPHPSLLRATPKNITLIGATSQWLLK